MCRPCAYGAAGAVRRCNDVRSAMRDTRTRPLGAAAGARARSATRPRMRTRRPICGGAQTGDHEPAMRPRARPRGRSVDHGCAHARRRPSHTLARTLIDRQRKARGGSSTVCCTCSCSCSPKRGRAGEGKAEGDRGRSLGELAEADEGDGPMDHTHGSGWLRPSPPARLGWTLCSASGSDIARIAFRYYLRWQLTEAASPRLDGVYEAMNTHQLIILINTTTPRGGGGWRVRTPPRSRALCSEICKIALVQNSRAPESPCLRRPRHQSTPARNWQASSHISTLTDSRRRPVGPARFPYVSFSVVPCAITLVKPVRLDRAQKAFSFRDSRKNDGHGHKHINP